MSWHSKTGYYKNSRGGVNENQPWTDDEILYLRDWTGTLKELSKLMGRSIKALQQQKSNLVSKVVDSVWKPTRWWRVNGPDGEVWCETSVEKEARGSMRKGDVLLRLYEKREQRWQLED